MGRVKEIPDRLSTRAVSRASEAFLKRAFPLTRRRRRRRYTSSSVSRASRVPADLGGHDKGGGRRYTSVPGVSPGSPVIYPRERDVALPFFLFFPPLLALGLTNIPRTPPRPSLLGVCHDKLTPCAMLMRLSRRSFSPVPLSFLLLFFLYAPRPSSLLVPVRPPARSSL